MGRTPSTPCWDGRLCGGQSTYQDTCQTQNIPTRGWDTTESNLPYYDAQTGHYQTNYLNHWLYEHTTQTVMLRTVQVYPLDRPPPDQVSILADLPQGCAQFLVLDKYLYGGHYYTIAWSPITEQWYNLDSMIYTSTNGCCQRMRDDDWQKLRVWRYSAL